MAGLERLADRELGGMEALFVKGDAEIASRSTVLALFMFDRELDFDDVLTAHERGSRKAVRFRQRVVAPVVPISRPYWIVDPDFDMRYHVRRTHLVDGGSPRDLLDAAERIGQVPLDPARPLWEVTLITGLDDGTSALLYKMHHAITDGGGGPALFAGIFTTAPAAVDRALPAAPAVEDVTATELTRQRAGQLPYQLVGAAAGAVGDLAGLGKRVLRSPRSSVGGALDYARSFRRTMATGPTPSPLFARRGLRRHYGTVSGSTNELRDAAKRMECSLNDVYIAALCGGVGRYHERMGLPVASIPLAMPVSLRRPDDPIDTNRFVGARIDAPTAVADVAERAKLIHERVLAVRSEPALGAISVLAPAASLLPMWLLTSVLAIQPSDVQASNIPSWTETQYLGSAVLTATFSFGPLAMSAVMSVMATYDDNFDIGLNIDADAVSDPGALVELIGAEFEALVSSGQIEVRA
jgi:diacylglycerol O-acyltransferase / wax synthase